MKQIKTYVLGNLSVNFQGPKFGPISNIRLVQLSQFSSIFPKWWIVFLCLILLDAQYVS